jgi:kynurenine formamidase
MASSDLPSYDQLPVRPDAPPRSSWGVWGDIGTDTKGCLNLLTPDRIVQAASLVQTGKVFALNLDATLPSPPLFGRAAFTHEVTGRPGGFSHDDLLHNWNTQSSSQWDGFRHVGNPTHGHYGGVADEAHGIHHWIAQIVGRAVLVDIGRWREAQGRPLTYDAPDPITPDDVLGCIADQGTPVEEGDVLLLRTGWMSWYRAQTAERRAEIASPTGLATPGLVPGEPTARLLWDLHIAAVAADNPALEVWPIGTFTDMSVAQEDPSRWPDVFVHTALLPLLGIPIGELWDLDALADDCAATGTYASFFTSAPLHVPNGVATPPNALAIR